jgi:hypothetical protein
MSAFGNSTGHGVLMGSNSPQASHGPMDIPWACGIPMAHGSYVANGGVKEGGACDRTDVV